MPWDNEVLEVNPACQVALHYVGPGKHKVLLADRFFKHPDHVSELALNLYYREAQALVGGYSGSRAVITLDTGLLDHDDEQDVGRATGAISFRLSSRHFSAILNRDYELTPGSASLISIKA